MSYHSREERISRIVFYSAVSVITVIILIMIFGKLSGFMPEYSSGERYGKVIKFSKKGIFFKSYEGVLTLSDFAVSNTETKMTFEFSCLDEEVAKTVILGQNVRLSYNEYLVGPFWLDSSYVLTSCTTQEKKE